MNAVFLCLVHAHAYAYICIDQHKPISFTQTDAIKQLSTNAGNRSEPMPA